jgi:murein DD-endopeptidase
MPRSRLSLASLLVAGCLIAGCSSVPRASDAERGAAIARAAARVVGTPYHFGGADAQGFDCSGLIAYAYEHEGLEVPRTAEEQRRAAHPVSFDDLLPGDVVFFRTKFHFNRHHADHVGIYSGDGRFIHAPRSGVAVSYANLNEGYYKKHFVSAGRFGETRR